MFPEHPEHGIIKVCAGRKGTPSKGFPMDVFGWEADKRKMVVVELVFAGLLIYGIFLSVGRIRKDLLQLRRKRLHEKRVKAMLSESNPFFARRICRYRAAGGRFRHARDLARIYGMDTAALRRLRPYIRIAAAPGANPSFHEPRPLKKSQYAYTPYPSRKLPRGRQLDLNAADSAELLRVPGVGPYFARRIVRYRQRLGGFVSPEQLREIPNLPDSVQTWFRVTAEKAQRPLRLNTATFRELLRHPYLNYEQVKAIVNYRERQGALQTLQELSLSEAFSAADLERLTPYVSFE